jgi:uncharacterized protein (TIGR03067 family)
MSFVEPETKGTWRQIAAVMDGKDIPVGRATLLTVADGNYVVTVHGKVYQKGTAKTEGTTTPRQSVVTVAQGPDAGKTFRQIFKVEGDVLMACLAPPEAACPTAFTSSPGSGQVLSVWLRVPEAAVPKATGMELNVRFWLAIIILVSIANGMPGMKQDLQEGLGYWGSVVVAGLLGAGILMVLGVFLLKWGWQRSLALGLSMAIAVNTFDEVKRAVTPSLGGPGAIVVSGSTGFVVAFVAVALLSRLLKVREVWPY